MRVLPLLVLHYLRRRKVTWDVYTGLATAHRFVHAFSIPWLEIASDELSPTKHRWLGSEECGDGKTLPIYMLFPTRWQGGKTCTELEARAVTET